MNFEALTRYLDRLPERGIPGGEMRVWVDHREVYSRTFGLNRGKPLDGWERYWLYSASKVICMTAGVQLIERGVIGLDDPISTYLPAYARLTVNDRGVVRPAKTVMTVRHAMSMCCGLDYDMDTPAIRACLEKYGRAATTVQLAECFPDKPLLFDPGAHYQYSLGHDVMAAVIEVASGMTYGEFCQKNIFDLLGMLHMTFHPTEQDFAAIADAWRWDDEGQLEPVDPRAQRFLLSDRYESGGAGLMGTPESYILLADALANGGVGRSGARILKPESIDLMRTNQLSGPTLRSFVQKMVNGRLGYGYGLGVRTLINNERTPAPLGEFGWDGAAGSYFTISPERHVAAFYAQHVLNCNLGFNEIHPAVRDLVYAGIDA